MPAARATKASWPPSPLKRLSSVPLINNDINNASGARRPSRPMPAARAAAKASPSPSLLERLSSLFQINKNNNANSGALRFTPAATAAAASIRALAATTAGGTAIPPKIRSEILALAETLRDEAPACRGSLAAAKRALSGTWRQAWSTEKETLFIFSTLAPLFGTKGEGAFQVIDAEAGRLQNVIKFANGASFVVESTLEVVESQADDDADEGDRGALPLRCNFRFTGATLKTPTGKEIRLPPAGKGWFETVYVDKDVRVALDVRKDTLVVERDGDVRWF
jgi:hypothetical protein